MILFVNRDIYLVDSVVVNSIVDIVVSPVYFIPLFPLLLLTTVNWESCDDDDDELRDEKTKPRR